MISASATLDSEAMQAEFPGAQLISESHQRAFPLEYKYDPRFDEEQYATVLSKVVMPT